MATTSEAAARVQQARAGYLPHVDVVESWQRGNEPAFVFGSLVSERRFTEANFALDALNHPAADDQHPDRVLGGTGCLRRRANALGSQSSLANRDIAQLGVVSARDELVLAVSTAYGRVLRAQSARTAAEAAVTTAVEDVSRTERRRDAGVVSEADVLALQVQLARMRERAICGRPPRNESRGSI